MTIDAENTEQNNTENIFQLPIEFLEGKIEIENHTKNDLELSPNDPKESLYKNVLKPITIFGENTMPSWSKYYTSDITFLTDSQKLLKNKNSLKSVDSTIQENVSTIWKEIKGETAFNEKYGYIDWERLNMLNNSSKFLQCLSIYNMTAPIFSLMLPIFFLILPLFILKLRGLPITIEKYFELLKLVFKKHQIGKIFDLSNASFEKIVYIIGSFVFYVIQIYQNIMTCNRFYYNMKKIHTQIFTMRDYIETTIDTMNTLKTQCQGLKSYEPFIENMKHHQAVCKVILKDLNQVIPNAFSIKKFYQIGHTMKCFYQLNCHLQFKETLEYTFGFNGYIDNINGIRKNISLKNIGACKLKNKKSTTKFKNAYFPSLVDENPVKNSYKLDKNVIITGPNAAGKTTLLKTTIFNIILSQQFGYGFYKTATIEPYDMIHCYINIPDTSARDSLFQAEANRCKNILNGIDTNGIDTNGIDTNGSTFRNNKKRHFCVFDELYSGTNPYEAISSAYAYLKYLHKYDNVNFVLTTHFLELCRRLEKEEGINNYHMKIETDNDTFKYTYKMEKGISSIKGGVKVLRDLEYPNEIINIANETLQELDI